MTDKSEKLFAVMTDSSRVYDSNVLARMPPERSKRSGFWTDDDPDAVWLMPRETADEVVSELRYNNPRVVRAEKALSKIEAQRDRKLEARARVKARWDAAKAETRPSEADADEDAPAPDGP